MIRAFKPENGRLQPVSEPSERLGECIWVDLLRPSESEEAAVEEAFGVEVPTREEMEEIEVSSRLYYDEGAVFMTATLPAHTDSDEMQVAPVTFVLTGERLVTVRYHEPRALEAYAQRAAKSQIGDASGKAVFMGLLEAIIERLADVLERAARDVDGISRSVFAHNARPGKPRDFAAVLESIGRKGDLLSNVRDSLVTLERIFGFMGQVVPPRGGDAAIRPRLKSLARDGRSLTDHASFLAQKNTFLLDATLGMINIEQNAIIKIFSMAAVVFLPPTLIASVYGMNFEHMPELGWPLGYPVALLAMLASAIVPFLYFKHRRWL